MTTPPADQSAPRSLSDAVLDSAPDAVVTFDEEGRIVGFNTAAEQLFGIDRRDALGASPAEAIVPSTARSGAWAQLVRVVADATAGAHGERFELAVPGAGGEERLVELTVVRSSEDGPHATAWLRELRPGAEDGAVAARREALLAAAVDLAAVGSWDWVPAESHLLWSKRLFRIFDLEPGELSPTPEYVFERTHPDDRERVRQTVAQLGASGRLAPLDYRITRPDGGVCHLRATLAVADWRGETPYRLVGWVQEVTERRQAEREIAAHIAVAAALTAWRSFDPGAETLLGDLAAALDMDAGVLWLREDSELRARILWPAGAPRTAEFEAMTRRSRVGRAGDLPGRAWRDARPAALRDVAQGTARLRAAARAGLRSAIAVPAVHGDEVLAVVELLSREEIEPTARLTRSLTAIGFQLGQFLARRQGDLEQPVLTVREREVLQLTAQGLSARQAAERLHVSPATVRTHLEHIYVKLGAGDKASAVARALRQGLIE